MWRQRAPFWAVLASTIVIVGLCVLWSVLAQTLVTPACDLGSLPANVGYLHCPADG